MVNLHLEQTTGGLGGEKHCIYPYSRSALGRPQGYTEFRSVFRNKMWLWLWLWLSRCGCGCGCACGFVTPWLFGSVALWI